jgi:hypothetical protein
MEVSLFSTAIVEKLLWIDYKSTKKSFPLCTVYHSKVEEVTGEKTCKYLNYLMYKRIKLYKVCIDEKRYYDAHEVLEELWFPRRFEEQYEVKLLKGFINAAVSFELHKRGRANQSKKVWKNYLKYRPLLLKVNTHKKEFYALSRDIENIYKQKHH